MTQSSSVVCFRADDVAQLDARAKEAGKKRAAYIREVVESEGVWVTYYPGEPGAHPYLTEMEARRAATGTGMSVKFVKYGSGI